MPNKMWQKIRLKKSYAEALAQVWSVAQPVRPVHVCCTCTCGSHGLSLLLPEGRHILSCFVHCQKAKACQVLLCLLIAAGSLCCQGPNLCCLWPGMLSLSCSQPRRCMP